MCVYEYIHINKNECTFKRIYIYMYIYTYTYKHIYICIYICTYIYMHPAGRSGVFVREGGKREKENTRARVRARARDLRLHNA